MGLFFNPQGRIGKGPFWIGVIVLLVISTALSAVSAYGPRTVGTIISLLSLVLIYPGVCVYVKRFHDAGKSGWWYLLVILLGFAITACASFFLVAPRFAELQGGPQPGGPEFQAAVRQITQDTFIPLTAVGVVVSLVIAFIVSMLPSDPGENKYGPPASGAAPATV